MKQLLLQEPGRFVSREVDIPTPQSDESLVRIHRIGVCGTDLHAYAGRQPFFSYPRVLGHELGVEIVEINGATHGLSIGDRCTIEPYRVTSQDRAARSGRTNCSDGLSVIGVHEDGGMQEYFRFPTACLHASSTLGFDALALVEPLCIGRHAANRAGIQPNQSVLVLGAGPIGLGVAQFACIDGANVVLADIRSDRLEAAQALLPIRSTLLVDPATMAAALRASFDGELPETVFDVTGNAASMDAAFGYTGVGGKLVFVGLHLGQVTFQDPDFHRKELTVMSSRNAVRSEFSSVIASMEAGAIDPMKWITHRCRFDDTASQLAHWTSPDAGVIKAVIELT